ncbi:MAG TPA: DUF6132 family protein [Candidatus Ozemobacteraceae bacterium]
MTPILVKIAYPAVGAAAGFLFYKFIGCSSGTCPITSSPVGSTIYGLLIGLILSSGR